MMHGRKNRLPATRPPCEAAGLIVGQGLVCLHGNMNPGNQLLGNIIFLLLALCSLSVNSNPAQAEQRRAYILTTATTGGTYYPVGVALATLVKIKLEPTAKISMSAINSAGSGENIKLLRDNEVQFALLQGIYGAWALAGEGQMARAGPFRELRAITMLWQNVEHYVIRSRFAGTGTIHDLNKLRGRKFSIGNRNSGAEGSGRVILENLGIDVTSLNLAFMGYGASANALQNSNIDGMNIPAGIPASAVTRAFAAMGEDITLLEFSGQDIARANGKFQLWKRFIIPAGTYPGQDRDIRTMAQPNFLAVRNDVPERDVYLLTRTMYENLAYLNSIHQATRAMALDQAIAGLPVPLHAGAVRYYHEMGIAVPDHLLPD